MCTVAPLVDVAHLAWWSREKLPTSRSACLSSVGVTERELEGAASHLWLLRLGVTHGESMISGLFPDSGTAFRAHLGRIRLRKRLRKGARGVLLETTEHH